MDLEQTIWLPPRATSFTEVCEACVEEHPELDGVLGALVRGSLLLERDHGWATCPRGHTMRVLRMSQAMPAGALW